MAEELLITEEEDEAESSPKTSDDEGSEGVETFSVETEPSERHLPEGVETFTVKTEDSEGHLPEGVKTFTVETEDAERHLPEGVETFTVETEAADRKLPEGVTSFTVRTGVADDQLPEGVESFVVKTETVKEDSAEKTADTVSGDGSLSDNFAVSDNKSVSDNRLVSDNVSVSDNQVVSENSVSSNGEGVSDNTVSADTLSQDKIRKDIFSVEFPKIDENDESLNFIMDPYDMIKRTEAAHYDGKEFQEGVNLFFKNLPEGEGDIRYTDTSDPKSIVNRGNIPVKVNVKVTVRQTISGDNEIIISEDPEFSETEKPAAAFSITDQEGNEVRMDPSGEMNMECILEAAPDDVCFYDEEEGKVRLKDDVDDSEFDALSFSIRGAINPKADWSKVLSGLEMEVTWSAEPAEEYDELIIDGEMEPQGLTETAEAETEVDEETDKDRLEGGIKGYGNFEGKLDGDVYSVIVPAYREDFYEFKMDPQKLIEATGGLAYPGKTFEKGKTLFFRNSDEDSKYDYSSTSDLMYIVNKGTRPIKISISVNIVSLDGVTLSDESDFKNNPFSQVYLSIVSGNGEPLEGVSYNKTGVSLETVIPAARQDKYDILWDANTGYTYDIPAEEEQDKETDEGFPRFEFRLTGSTNEEAEWWRLKRNSLQITVEWNISQLNEDGSADGGYDETEQAGDYDE